MDSDSESEQEAESKEKSKQRAKEGSQPAKTPRPNQRPKQKTRPVVEVPRPSPVKGKGKAKQSTSLEGEDSPDEYDDASDDAAGKTDEDPWEDDDIEDEGEGSEIDDQWGDSEIDEAGEAVERAVSEVEESEVEDGGKRESPPPGPSLVYQTHDNSHRVLCTLCGKPCLVLQGPELLSMVHHTPPATHPNRDVANHIVTIFI